MKMLKKTTIHTGDFDSKPTTVEFVEFRETSKFYVQDWTDMLGKKHQFRISKEELNRDEHVFGSSYRETYELA